MVYSETWTNNKIKIYNITICSHFFMMLIHAAFFLKLDPAQLLHRIYFSGQPHDLHLCNQHQPPPLKSMEKPAFMTQAPTFCTFYFVMNEKPFHGMFGLFPQSWSRNNLALASKLVFEEVSPGNPQHEAKRCQSVKQSWSKHVNLCHSF